MKKYFSFFILIISICDLRAQDFRINQWETTDFIWDFGIISSCNVGLNKRPIQYFEREHQCTIDDYKNIKEGDIVWTRCRFVTTFAKDILPHINHKFILVISDGDESFPSNCGKDFDWESFVSHEKIFHIFAQNCDYQGNSNKVSHLPIGIDYHTIAYKSPHGGWGEKGTPSCQEDTLKNILRKALPTHARIKKAFVDFQLSDTMHAEYNRYMQFGEDRASIFKRLLETGLIDSTKWMRRSKLWEKKAQYAFSISPHGNGLDCHRTWEDLILGCIVIVKTSLLDPMYEGLPVVIVKNWSEITQKNMDIWLEKYNDAFTNQAYREKLTHNYWFNKISLKSELCKKAGM